MKPREELKKGASLLQPIFDESGFTFQVTDSGDGSGGPFAQGEFVKEGRKLTFSVRYSLGLVTYHVGSLEIGHSEYLNAIGVKGQYPGFSDNIQESFRHLKADLEKHGNAFLQGSEFELRKVFQVASQQPKKKGFSAI